MQQIASEPVDSVEITILVDKLFDGLLVSEEPARRPPFGPHLLNVPSPFMERGRSYSDSTKYLGSSSSPVARKTVVRQSSRAPGPKTASRR